MQYIASNIAICFLHFMERKVIVVHIANYYYDKLRNSLHLLLNEL